LLAGLQRVRLLQIDSGRMAQANNFVPVIDLKLAPVKVAAVSSVQLVPTDLAFDPINPTCGLIARVRVAGVSSARLVPIDPGPTNLTCGRTGRVKVVADKSARTCGQTDRITDQIDPAFGPIDLAKAAEASNGVRVIARGTVRVFVPIVRSTTTT
jgi:hypothetical protein